MPSLRSTVFLWLIRHRHLFKLKLKPEVVDESFSVEEFRASVDRVAPEHPFPAAVDDCVAAYSWLLERGYASQDIVVGGESAGGTLTLSLLHDFPMMAPLFPEATRALEDICGFVRGHTAA